MCVTLAAAAVTVAARAVAAQGRMPVAPFPLTADEIHADRVDGKIALRVPLDTFEQLWASPHRSSEKMISTIRSYRRDLGHAASAGRRATSPCRGPHPPLVAGATGRAPPTAA